MKRKIFIMLHVAILFLPTVQAQGIRSMEFKNQSVVDILMALAEVSGASIIPDETVSGNASFHFTDSNLLEALDIFLSQYKLYYRRQGNAILVSRIDASWDEDNRRVSIRAEEVELESLIKSLSKTVGVPILYDPLPAIPISIAMRDITLETALEIFMARLGEYDLVKEDAYYYIRKRSAGQEGLRRPGESWITREGDRYSIRAEGARLMELIEELFQAGEREYSILAKGDTLLGNLTFGEKTFEELLAIILEQGNADYTIHNDIYYILESQRRDVLKKFKETRVIPLLHLQAQEFLSIIPSELAAGNFIKIDKGNNSIILNGNSSEIQPIIDFAELIDRPMEGVEYRKFPLKYIAVTDLLAMLPPRLLSFPPIEEKNANSFIALGSRESLDQLSRYVAAVDRKAEGYPIKLKYMKSDELFKNLPPSVTKEDLIDSGYPNLVFFTGPEEKRKLFLRELGIIDKPKPQIRYELLVIEYMKHKETKTSANFSVTKTDELPAYSFMGKLGNIMNLSFDVVTQFGYQFAADLSFQLGENLAQVYADTTLYGISGQEIKFQNTDTYRYQEFEVDKDTGSVSRAGITREISSGLIVSLNGWISGDDMITMSVQATVSKQNNNQMSPSTSIPSTSERIVNTRIRSPSGKPVILSGLLKDDSNKNVKKIPLLGDIPLLKYFFSDLIQTKERTEIVIYIVPYLMEDPHEENNIPLRIERYYHTLLEDNLHGKDNSGAE